ncbi:hypothetical protein JXD38_11745 [candidate division WOR-3 bacterium]|nr:hypothetical protein [candidate division WOR-3 bacterium]
MSAKCVFIAVIILVATLQVPAQAQERSRAEVYTLEGLGALPGVAGCGCLAMGLGTAAVLAAWGGGSKATIAGAVALELVSAAVLPAAAAYGTARVGGALGQKGSTGCAVLGAYAGLPLAAGAIALGVRVMNDPHAPDLPGVAVPLYVLGGMAIPVGAVVGYNLGAKPEPGSSRPGLGGRLEFPAVALAGTELPDHSFEYGVKVRLAGLRF